MNGNEVARELRNRLTATEVDEVYSEILAAFGSIPEQEHKRLTAALLISLCSQIKDKAIIQKAIELSLSVVAEREDSAAEAARAE